MSSIVVSLTIVGFILLAAGWTVSVLVASQRAEHDARQLHAKHATPPESAAERWRNRTTVCARHGHTWRVAFPLGRLARQCVQCGAIAAPVTIKTHRLARG